MAKVEGTLKAVLLELGIEVREAPPDDLVAIINNDEAFKAHIPKFGAPNGMLVFSAYDAVRPIKEFLLDQGYGFTVLNWNLAEVANRSDIVELLSDWGWCGSEKDRPTWIKRKDS